MPILNIQPIERAGSFVIISIAGPSGAGKTRTAIEIARGLVGPNEPFGFLDTETGRGRHHADAARPCNYAELTPPFSPDRYIEAIDDFERTGVKALVIDSGSHEHEGIGGLIEMAEATKRTDYGKWAAPKAKHKKFVARLLSARMHIIVCCRARQPIREVPKEDGSGKKEVVVGDWKEIQEKNFVYEMGVSILLRPDGTRKITKCPADLLPAFPEPKHPKDWLTSAAGRFIAQWVAGGSPVDHAFEELRREGQEIAEKGVEAFRLWWNSDEVKPKRDQLKPFLDNFQSIAKTADEEAERVRIENAAATDVLPEKKPAAAPPRADLLDTGMPSGFWDNDDLVIAVPQRAGKSSWQAWASLMRKAADSAPDVGDLRPLG